MSPYTVLMKKHINCWFTHSCWTHERFAYLLWLLSVSFHACFFPVDETTPYDDDIDFVTSTADGSSQSMLN